MTQKFFLTCMRSLLLLVCFLMPVAFSGTAALSEEDMASSKDAPEQTDDDVSKENESKVKSQNTPSQSTLNFFDHAQYKHLTKFSTQKRFSIRSEDDEGSD